jgi:hypothetical protein
VLAVDTNVLVFMPPILTHNFTPPVASGLATARIHGLIM